MTDSTTATADTAALGNNGPAVQPLQQQRRRPFKVLIAGGSVIGLTLANVLAAAGIDFVVLEKRDIAPELGAAISMLSNTSRVFRQLGFLDRMHEGGVPLKAMHRVDGLHAMKTLEESRIFKHIGESTHLDFYFLQRKFFLEVLYEHLGEEGQAKVRPNCGLKDYVEHENGVTVTTTTGETIEGDMLVGADGVHSQVRELMAQRFEDSEPERAKGLREGEFLTFYLNQGLCDRPLTVPYSPSHSIHNLLQRHLRHNTKSIRQRPEEGPASG